MHCTKQVHAHEKETGKQLPKGLDNSLQDQQQQLVGFVSNGFELEPIRPKAELDSARPGRHRWSVAKSRTCVRGREVCVW